MFQFTVLCLNFVARIGFFPKILRLLERHLLRVFIGFNTYGIAFAFGSFFVATPDHFAYLRVVSVVVCPLVAILHILLFLCRKEKLLFLRFLPARLELNFRNKNRTGIKPS